ncbi:MAG: FprA family A-type flavoprotein [Candidatus Bipolaricaulota bacterium]|nr:FprA family A-type flavoprotein [Candidatus Bipolaricaulota bacterium]
MNAREIKPGVLTLGAQDFDRRLFDVLIPLPDGTSYNVYLVKGSEKVVLIDAVDPAKISVLQAQLSDVEKVDYLIVQHVEQDHTGSVPWVLERYPNAQILTSAKARPMLIDHLHIDSERITTVADGETISLGDKTLEFIYAPWVHWPETMLTYLREEKILFTCDFFGSHLATTEIYAHDKGRVYEAAKRYYAEIMMPFRTMISKHLKRLEGYEISMICPSHGQVYDDPSFIIGVYRQWVLDEPRDMVLLPYVSMHGSTQVMVDRLITALVDRGIEVAPFNLTVTDTGKLAEALVDASAVVFGTPTVLVGPHPSVVSAAYLINALRPKLKYAGVIGSYGWGGKAVDTINSLMASLKLDWFDPVMVKGLPREDDLARIDSLAEDLAGRIKGD